MEPQFVIPPIEKAEIKSATDTITDDDHNGVSDKPINTIIRELIPKRKSKDANLKEKVEYFENGIFWNWFIYAKFNTNNFQIQDKEARVIYEPLDSELPFYYPKVWKSRYWKMLIINSFWQVKAYSFVYDSGYDESFEQ